LLYGIVPGLAVLFESIVVHGVVSAGWGFLSVIMIPSMTGLVIGGLLDRITEAIIAWKKRRRT
jgi:hypothetical protein